MKRLVPNFEDFANEGKVSDRIIEIAEDLENAIDSDAKMSTKELDEIAKQTLSKIDLKFYKDYKDNVIEIITGDSEREISEDYTTDLNKVEKEFAKMQKKAEGTLMDGKIKEMWLDLGIKLKIISEKQSDKILKTL